MQLDEVAKRLKEKQITFSFSDQLCDWLGEKGYDPVYGARPLKRLIQNEVLNPLAKKLIAGEIKPGAQLKADLKDQEVQFST